MVKIKKFGIPKRRYSDLERLLDLKDDHLALIAERLNQLDPELDFSQEFISDLGKAIDVEERNAESLLHFIREVFVVYIDMKLSMEDFIKSFKKEIIDANDEKIIPKDGNWDRFESFFKTILSMDNTFGAMAKGVGIILDLPKIFFDSRILSDFRPIFSSNVEETPKSGLIIHNLKIRYMKNGKSRDFLVSLSSEDLNNLKDTIERAFSKDANLEKTFQEKGIKILHEIGE